MSLCLITATGEKTQEMKQCQVEYACRRNTKNPWENNDGQEMPNTPMGEEEEICSPGICPRGEEKTFLQIHATDSFTVVTGVQKFCCGMCGRAEVAVGSDNVCSWLCWGQRASSCALGQQGHEQPEATWLPHGRDLVWDAGFLLCLLLTKSNRGEIDFIIYIYI